MKKILFMLLVGSVMSMGCSKILQQKPYSALDAATAFTTGPAVTAGLLGVYNDLQQASYYGTDYTLLCDLEADNLDHTGSFPQYEQVKNRAITPDNVTIQNTWNQIYAGINRVNTVIADIPKITDASFDSAGAMGEARFLRAFMYFDVMRYWGGTPSGYWDPNGLGVPLVLTPTFTAADAAPHARSTAGQVFAQILDDVNFAIANIPSSNDFGRANTLVAQAFKARVELYMGNYDGAAADALAAIQMTSGNLEPNYPNIWVTKNDVPESVFELQFSATNTNGLYFYYFGRDEVASSASLQAAYDPSDTRLPVNFYQGVDASGNSVNATTKYILPDGSNDITLIRLAEMYLTHAEGVIRGSSPNVAEAVADINVVRARAGLAPTTASTVSDVEDEILLENRLEFPHECHRWFDLRRLGLAASTFGVTDSTKILWPIPQAEVLTSGGVIKQNPNY
ncbi:MAG TPA: RagB/SusD family nutrient uptake outer membrane protein [Puia sp.]|nr:RagB/SusD family nutrient uptake outer membrane protein [Puia sp.]